MGRFLKALICISLVILLFSGAEGKRKRPNKDKDKPSEPSVEGKKEGETCTFPNIPIPWGTCSKPVSCPMSTQHDCGAGLSCCRSWQEHKHDEAAISKKEYPAYLKLHDNLYN